MIINLDARFVLLYHLLPSLVAAAALSGCVLLGAGAAAVGGCALLDRNDDNTVTALEASAGLFEDWDTNGNGELSESEFAEGVDQSEAFEDWSDAFGSWDLNENGTLSDGEFRAGVTEGDPSTWADRQCDDLGL